MRWELTDLTGRRLAFIKQRDPGAFVQVDLNGHRAAQCTIDTEDRAAAEVYPLARRLRVWLETYETRPIFYGPITSPQFVGKSGKITVNALGPTHQLEAAFIPFPSSWVPDDDGAVWTLIYTDTDQSEIMAQLFEYGDFRSGQVLSQGPLPTINGASLWPSHGIVRGTLPASVKRDRTYEPGKQMWQAITELGNVIGGPDFDFEPLYNLQGKTAQLNTYPQGQGKDRSKDVRFEFNTGRNNCDDFTWTPDGPSTVTQATEVGQASFGGEPPHYTAVQDDAGKVFGKWESFQGRPDVNQSFTIEEHASGVIAAYAFPPDIIEVTPNLKGNPEGLSVPPSAHPDPDSLAPADGYWIGDQVSALAKKGYFRFENKARVVSIKLTEADAAGNIQEKVTLASTIFEAGAT
jgi:hypothetical protein